MGFRDFNAAASEILADRPRFELGPREWTCKPTLSTKTMLAFFTESESAETSQMLDVIRKFFDAVLIKADREPFKAMLDSDEDDDDAIVIDIAQLSAVVTWLVEQYTGKASEPSQEPSTSPMPTGALLKSVSLDPGSVPQYSSVG